MGTLFGKMRKKIDTVTVGGRIHKYENNILQDEKGGGIT